MIVEDRYGNILKYIYDQNGEIVDANDGEVGDDDDDYDDDPQILFNSSGNIRNALNILILSYFMLFLI